MTMRLLPRLSVVVFAAVFLSPPILTAQQVALDSAFLAGYRWRNLGPDRGGRSIAVSGVVGQPEVAYFRITSYNVCYTKLLRCAR